MPRCGTQWLIGVQSNGPERVAEAGALRWLRSRRCLRHEIGARRRQLRYAGDCASELGARAVAQSITDDAPHVTGDARWWRDLHLDPCLGPCRQRQRSDCGTLPSALFVVEEPTEYL